LKKLLLVISAIFTANANAAEPEVAPALDPKTSQVLDLGLKLAQGDTDAIKSQGINLLSNEAANHSKSFLEKYFPTVELWLGMGDPNQPTAGVLVVSPLSDPKDIKNTLFTQGSVYHFDDRTTVNLGLGYRRLEWDNKILLGVNGFYDHEFPYDHGRTSLGLEARTSVGEVNFNQYWGVTGWKAANTGYEERALGGTDLELGVPLPYMNWAKIYGRGFIWNSVDGVSNLKGNDISLRAQVPVLPGLAIEAGHRSYNNLKDEDFLRITYNLMNFNAAKPSQPWFSETAYQLASMEDRRYEKVRRENLIMKQKKNAQFSVTVRGF
jgi:adhesin/invasin